MCNLKQVLDQAKHICSIKEIVIANDLTKNIYEICKQYSNDIFLVADENTVSFLNKSVLSKISHLIIFGNSIASLDVVELVKNKAKNKELIVAFGSGTINDICKYASYIEGKDYVSFPTAASMNGYTSTNASILVNGKKNSFKAHLAKAIYIDIGIIANSPSRLTLSGFADFICRSTVQADWLLSHLLLNTEYNTLPFTLIYEMEQILLREYIGLAKNDIETVLILMEALLISGIGMVISGGSYSASQGEHIIAHAIEMITEDYSLLHGEKIAVTSITMANLQEKILSMRNLNFKSFSTDIQSVKKYFNTKECIQIFEQKQIIQQKVKKIIHQKWEDISFAIKQNLLHVEHLQKIFTELSIPHLPEHLGWNKDQYHEIVSLAFATRDRFTFLDLANFVETS
ncbi:iron-containing alcohol dehydrogenase [Wolbachia endosymbiont of Chironomus riparius]|uniref:iron-containing alcohol dehydrogenase n=1 Tax=Wolbachia endosymbiont of Chironomus riparius TaxID=2883238 RepID=UPI00209E5AC8|nr:iron-containing alcohol dehydrogenase [Wolbachia endosymbiont of Chironomus riparius]